MKLYSILIVLAQAIVTAARMTYQVCPSAENYMIQYPSGNRFQVKCDMDINNEQDLFGLHFDTLWECGAYVSPTSTKNISQYFKDMTRINEKCVPLFQKMR